MSDRKMFGVRCTMGDHESMLITVHAPDRDAALAEVRAYHRMFGPGDAAGNWLASQRDPAKTIVCVHDDVREMSE